MNSAFGQQPYRHGPGQGRAFAFLTLAIWSFWPVWTRKGVLHSLGADDIVFLRFLVGGLVFLPILLFQARSIPRRAWLVGLFLSLCQGAPFVLLMAGGLRYAPAHHAAAIATGVSPVFVALFGALAFGEAVGRTRRLGLILVLGGTATLSIASAGGAECLGHLFFLAAAAMAAIYIVCVPHSGLSAFQAAAMVSVFSMAAWVPAYLALGLGKLSEAPLADVLVQGAYQGILVAVVSFVLFNAAIVRLGAAQMSALCALVPVFTLLLAIPVLHEWPRPIEIASVVLIAIGVYIAAQAMRSRGGALAEEQPTAGPL